MSDDDQTGERYLTNLNAFVDAMRGPDPIDSTVSHRCARFNATLDEASVEGHGERCFVVGDHVVATNLGREEVEGRIAEVLAPSLFSVQISRSMGGCVAGSHLAFGAPALRHIQRPGQTTERTQCCICGKYDAVSWECDHGKAKQPAPPAPTLYDGLTSMECFARWYENRQRVEFGHPTVHALTVGQIAQAKVEWLASHGQSASRLLRARIDAARERERSQVQMPDDDAWLANCRDAE